MAYLSTAVVYMNLFEHISELFEHDSFVIKIWILNILKSSIKKKKKHEITYL